MVHGGGGAETQRAGATLGGGGASVGTGEKGGGGETSVREGGHQALSRSSVRQDNAEEGGGGHTCRQGVGVLGAVPDSGGGSRDETFLRQREGS